MATNLLATPHHVHVYALEHLAKNKDTFGSSSLGSIPSDCWFGIFLLFASQQQTRVSVIIVAIIVFIGTMNKKN